METQKFASLFAVFRFLRNSVPQYKENIRNWCNIIVKLYLKCCSKICLVQEVVKFVQTRPYSQKLTPRNNRKEEK